MSVSVEGVEDITRNINEQIARMEGNLNAGLWEAGLQIQRVSQEELQASVVTGNLRASAYTRTSTGFERIGPTKLDADKNFRKPTGKVDGVEVGYTALYALFAHENMEGRAPKFLEVALRRNEKAIVDIVAKQAKLK